jgi:UDPglucose 6-dehydrogenase
MQIAVVGSGYVGLVAAVGFCEIGHSVTCIDNDLTKLERLKNGVTPIHEKFIPELIQKHRSDRLRFSDDLPAATKDSSVIFIAVGTPENGNGEADISYVEAVAREIAGAISTYKVIVEKSTVPVYTSKWIRRVMLLNGAPQEFFDVVSNPEFLKEGTAVVDFLYPDRIVIGGDNPAAVDMVRRVYGPLTGGSYYRNPSCIPGPDSYAGKARLILTSTISAELIKYASNAFLATKISFINAVASICEAVGADIGEVAEGIGSDSRIGAQFLKPGIGYGGSCFPKDLKAFRSVANEAGYDFSLLGQVSRINDDMRLRFLNKVRKALWTLKGKKLGVLGVAFKGGTDDVRESSAIPIIRSLCYGGCAVTIYDPGAMEHGREVLKDCPGVEFAESAYGAAEGKDALVILTDWEEFAGLDLGVISGALRYHLIIDGRNLFDPGEVTKHGLGYISMGRADAFPDKYPVFECSLLRKGERDSREEGTAGCE